jgi:hypothetical protein
MRRFRHLFLIVVPAVLVLAAAAACAATINIVVVDGVGEGFNDPTAAAPVGGNPGTTLGAQRLNVFNRAAQVWGAILPSTVTILVEASFDPLTCNATSAILGSASTISIFANFPNAPFSGTWYHGALADKLASSDLNAGVNDIDATFNSNLNGSPGCLGGAGWYYGFDGNEGSNIDLLPVVLHEIAHGLGFSTFTSLTTGNFNSGLPDIFARFLFDRTQNQPWTALTPAQRALSAVNTSNVVWNGPVTTAASPLILARRTVVVVNSPGGIAGTYSANPATFGPPHTVAGLTGNVVLAIDGVAPVNDACTALTNAAQMAGNIAFIDRGTCAFVDKAIAAQNAGAIGVIIANNVAGPLAPGGASGAVMIPVVGITQVDGTTIRNQLGAGVNVTLRIDLNQGAGADPQGRLLMYAPNPLQQGSSISHFDVTAIPNLLMEPAINSDLQAEQVDLTRYLLQDIGWFTGATDASQAPSATRIHANYPNPFNPNTSIRFDLHQHGRVRLDVYDLAGRLVKHLADGPMTAGTQAVRWDGTDSAGRKVATGVYVARLAAGGTVDTHRMVLLK